MRYTRLRLVAVSAAIAGSCFSAHAAPVANLPLTCPSSFTGLHQNQCSGMKYQLPDSELTLLGTDFIWIWAPNVANTDGIAICTLPVEPGTYSSCRDASGVRRIAFVAKSQIFASPPPPPPPSSGTRVLDLSRTPVEIIQPGVYVLDRNWDAPFNVPPNSAIHINANDVTLDLQGFELMAMEGGGIRSFGGNVIIRNGRVRTGAGVAIEVSGGSRIENMSVRADSGAIILAGSGATLSNSVVTGGVVALSGAIVRDNSLFGARTPLRMESSRATAVGNDVGGCAIGSCITVDGQHNIVERNRILMLPNGVHKHGLIVAGDYNLVMGNVFGRCAGSTAILIALGRENIVRGNLAPRSEPQEFGGAPPQLCGTGIDFDGPGTFYGDNIMWATLPFKLSGSETDLGGNVGFDH